VLIAAGVFALALALLLPLFVYPRLALQPDDPAVMQVQTTSDGTALIPDLKAKAGAVVRTGIPITIKTYISQNRGQVAEPGSVVWTLGTRVVADGTLLQARVESVSLDKHTAEPTNCCNDSLATQENVPGVRVTHSGLVTFPFNSKKRDYRVWDVNLRRTRVAAYSGESTRNGMRVNTYTAVNAWEPVSTQELPGSLFGLSDPSVTATGQYADRRIYFVEPATGATLGVEEWLNQRYVYQGRSVTAMSAHLQSPSLEKKRVDQTRQGAAILPWMRGRIAIVLVVLALGAFAGAAALLVRRRPTRYSETRSS
jgi:DUF3068 family protein